MKKGLGKNEMGQRALASYYKKKTQELYKKDKNKMGQLTTAHKVLSPTKLNYFRKG